MSGLSDMATSWSCCSRLRSLEKCLEVLSELWNWACFSSKLRVSTHGLAIVEKAIVRLTQGKPSGRLHHPPAGFRSRSVESASIWAWIEPSTG